jgi:hypothetical protein
MHALNMDFKPYLPSGPYRLGLTVDATLRLPLES